MIDIKKLVMEYAPDEARVHELAGAKLVLIVGITGAGKDTIKHRLIATGDYYNFISHTTRAPRENSGIMELSGREYHFVSLEKAAEMLSGGEFIEAKEYAGNVYGTSFAGLEQANATEAIAINDVEVQGVAEYKKLLPATIAIFILPPTYDEWRKRLGNRYDEDELERVWPARRDAAVRELEYALKVPYYHFVINDDLDQAVRAVQKIVSSADSFSRKDDVARLAARDILDEIRKHR